MILFEAIRLYCKKHKIGPRQLSRETGIPINSAAVFLRGEREPEAENFALLLRWVLQKSKQEDEEQS
jgi:hypothetical protein